MSPQQQKRYIAICEQTKREEEYRKSLIAKRVSTSERQLKLGDIDNAKEK